MKKCLHFWGTVSANKRNHVFQCLYKPIANGCNKPANLLFASHPAKQTNVQTTGATQRVLTVFARIVLLPAFFCCLSLHGLAVVSKTATTSGDWNTAATWGGTVPTNGDNIVINSGVTVTVSTSIAATSVATITINGSGKLTISGGSLVTTDVVTYAAIPSGNITVSGGSFTVGGTITVPASTTLAITSGSITITGASSFSGGTVNIVDGTFTSNNTVAITNGAINISGGSSIFNNTITLSGSSALNMSGGTCTVNSSVTQSGGTVTCSGGTVNFGSASAHTYTLNNAAATFIVQTGATVNIASQYIHTKGTYTQTGGTLTVPTVANTTTNIASFGITSAKAVNLNGGTIVIGNQSTGAIQLDYYENVIPTVSATTPTTVQIGNATTAALSNFLIRGYTTNLTVNNSSGNHPSIYQAAATTVMGDLTLNGAGAYNLGLAGLTMAGLNTAYPGNINVNGTNVLTLGTNKSAALSFTGASGNQQLNLGNGTIVSNQVWNLTINNTSTNGGRVTLPSGLTIVTGSTLNLTKGIVDFNGNVFPSIHLGSGSTITGTPSASSFINGSVERDFAANTTATDNSTLLPVGISSTYMPIYMAPTRSSGTVSVFATPHTGNTGTNFNPAKPVSSNYWQISYTGSNLTSVVVRLTDAGIASTDNIIKAKNDPGLYSRISVASTYAAGSPPTLTSAGITKAELDTTAFIAYGSSCSSDAIGINGPSNIALGATSQLVSSGNYFGTWALGTASPTGAATITGSTTSSEYAKGAIPGTANILFTINSTDGCNGFISNKTLTIANKATPGGVGNDLISWYKADKGFSTGTWADQAGINNLDATNPQGTSQLLNFNQSVNFPSGANTSFSKAVTDGWLGMANPTTYYYVAVADNGYGSISNITAISRGAINDNLTSFHSGVDGANYFYANGTQSTGTTGITSGMGWPIPHLTSLVRAGYNGSSFYGATSGFQTDATNGSAVQTIAAAAPFYIGKNVTNTANNWTGSIAEVIAYNGKQGTGDIAKINSYLCLKYAIPMGFNNLNYVASDSTIIWTPDTNNNVNNDITGIGKDDGSGLLQKQSQNYWALYGTGSNELAVSLGTIAASNADNTASFSGTGNQYLIWSCDPSPEVPSVNVNDLSIVNSRFNKWWRMVNTNFNDTVTLYYPAKFFVGNGYLIVNNSELTSGATAIAMNTTTPVTIDKMLYYSVTVPPSAFPINSIKYFTFGFEVLQPGGVSGAALWTRADVGSSTFIENDDVTTLNDQSNNGSNLTNLHIPPKYRVNAFNYNPSIDFGTIGAFGTMINTEISLPSKDVFMVSNFTGGTTFGDNNGVMLTATASVGNAPANTSVFWGNSGTTQFYTEGADPAYNNGTTTTTTGIRKIDGNITNDYGNLVNPHISYLNNTNDNFNNGYTRFYFGSNIADITNTSWQGNIPEVISFSTNLNNTDQAKVNTYLALKYGITLGTDYLGSYGLPIYTLGGAANNIIGIGRSDITALNQKQSHRADDSVRIYVGSLAATNNANANTITHDTSYVIMGDDGGSFTDNTTDKPNGFASRINRVYKLRRTGFTDPFSIELILPTGYTVADVSKLRLLVSSTPTMAAATTVAISNAGFSLGSIIITVNKPAAVFADNTDSYFAIGTQNITALPVTVTNFTGVKTAGGNQLSWGIDNAVNFGSFVLQKSADGSNFTAIASVPYHATQSNYGWLDAAGGAAFYRLQLVDKDGSYNYSNIVHIGGNNNTPGISIYPNPAKDKTTLTGTIAGMTIRLLDAVGKILQIQQTTGVTEDISFTGLAKGLYSVQVFNKDGQLLNTTRIVKE